MKLALLGLMFLTSLSAFASLRCENSLHQALLSNYENMSQPYTAFYLEINDELNVLCANNNSSSMKVLCINSCERDAEVFHDTIKTKFRVSAKVKQLKAECKSLCEKADF